MAGITIRPATRGDKAAVSELCALIWDGEDYVPEVFDEWVADPAGEFTLAFDGPQLVALGKLTGDGPDEWWLEGLRVHPDHRGRGLARLLHEHAVQLADRVGSGVLRFATAGSNAAVHALARRTAFELVSRHFVARAGVAPGYSDPVFVPAAAEELAALRSWLAQSECFAAAGGLMEDNWAWCALLPRLESLLGAGRLFWWRDGDTSRAGLVVINNHDDEDEARLWVNFAGATPGRLPRLWRDLRQFGAARGAQTLRAKPLATDEMASALEAAGWQFEPAHTMWVFARPLTAAGRA
jgi:GNAT superfamily N-acetyltransferase